MSRQLGEHKGFYKLIRKKSSKSSAVDKIFIECCMNIRTCYKTTEKAIILIPTEWIDGGLNRLKLWIRFMKKCNLPCKYVGIGKTREWKEEIDNDDHIFSPTKAFKIEIDYKNCPSGPHALAVFTALRYLYSPMFKGLVDSALKLREDYSSFSYFKCLYLAHYNSGYSEYYGMRFKNASYPITLKEFKERCKGVIKYSIINLMFDNGVKENMDKPNSYFEGPSAVQSELGKKRKIERLAYLKTLKLFKKKEIKELLLFLKDRKVEKVN